MKHLRFFIVSTLISSGGIIPVFADIVTPETALKQAESFRNSIIPTRAVAGDRSPDGSVSPQLVYQGKTLISESPSFYVFNYGEGDGYAIISADDSCIPVLGYVDQGDFNIDNIPDNMKLWLEGYAREIASVASSAQSRHDSYPTAGNGRRQIEPLIKTKWNQGNPYNKLCPRIRAATAPTGCTATAMAQIMNYHQWPQDYGSGSWSFSRNGISAEFDFSQTKFDWENMADTYGTKSSTEQQNAVATLMYACGVATDMFYNTSESGAYMFYVPEALIYYFGYDGMARYVSRNNYSFSEWEQMLYDELAEGRPVQYEGYAQEGGHSFIIDGYLGNNFFHFNWGWGGESDGYFVLTALNPTDQGTGSYEGGYNSQQAAVIGIQPPAQDEVEAFVSLDATGPLSLSSDNAINISSWLTHNSMFSHDISFGIKAVSEADNSFSLIVKSSLPEMTMGGYIRGKNSLQYGENQDIRNFSIPFPADELKTLEEGAYRLYPVYTTSTMGWEEIPVENGPAYVSVYLGADSSLSPIDPLHPVNDLTVLDLASREMFTWSDGTGNPVEMIIANNSDGDFDGKLSFTFTDADSGSIVSSGDFKAMIPYRRALSVSIGSNLPAASGNYILSVFDGKNPISDNIPVSVTTFTHGDIYVSAVELPANCYENMDFSSQKLYVNYVNSSKTESASMKPAIQLIDRPIDPVTLKTVSGSDRVMSAGETKRLSYSKFDFSTDGSYLKAGHYYLQVFDTYTEVPLSLPVAVRIWKEDDLVENLFVGIGNDGQAYITPRATAAEIPGRPESDPYSGVLDIPEIATVNGVTAPITSIAGQSFSMASPEGIVVRSDAFSPSALAIALNASAAEDCHVYVLPENTEKQFAVFANYGINTYVLASEISFEIESGDLTDLSSGRSVFGFIHAENAGSLWDPEINVSSTNDNISVILGERNSSGDIPVEIRANADGEKALVTISPRQPYALPISLEINGYESSSVSEISYEGFSVAVSGMEANIAGLPAFSDIDIFTSSGEHVAHLKASSSGTATFSSPAHGIYIIKCGKDRKKIIL